jgi:exosortase family protein XrtF
MKDFLPVLKILLRFVVIYIVVVLLYQFYLNAYMDDVVDPFTRWVAVQVALVQNALGFPTVLVDSLNFTAFCFRLPENSPQEWWKAVMFSPLRSCFLLFVFAFYKGSKTFLFVLGGLVLLHILNVSRIVLLNIIFQISSIRKNRA